MRRTSAIWLAAAAALIIIGAIAVIAVLAKSNWSLAALGGTKYETRTVEIKESFKNISVSSDTEDIDFLPAEDGKCRVVLCDSEKEKHSAEVVGDTLSITRVETGKWHEHWSLFSEGKPSITVYLPGREYGSLAVDESTGDILIEKDFIFDSIDVSLSTGDVKCFASAKGQARIETSTGDIRAENITAGELALRVSTGRVEVSSASCGGGVNISVTTGKTFLKDVACGDLVTGGSTGSLTMNDVVARGAISVERSTGDVTLERCDAAELEITTDTGDVKGSLLSEKVFIVRTDTGRIDVPETVSGGKCRITTDTGDIEISIV